MDVLSLNAVAAKDVIILIFIRGVLLGSLDLAASGREDETHRLLFLVNHLWSKRKMVFLSSTINSIKLGNSAVGANDLAVSEEAPDLSQSHREALFTLLGLNFAGIDFVPVFEVAVCAEHYVLNFLLDLLGSTGGRGTLHFDKVANIKESLEWVLLNFPL